jgi:hypothetical protein
MQKTACVIFADQRGEAAQNYIPCEHYAGEEPQKEIQCKAEMAGARLPKAAGMDSAGLPA